VELLDGWRLPQIPATDWGIAIDVGMHTDQDDTIQDHTSQDKGGRRRLPASRIQLAQSNWQLLNVLSVQMPPVCGRLHVRHFA
jgi:hypothetical protein